MTAPRGRWRRHSRPRLRPPGPERNEQHSISYRTGDNSPGRYVPSAARQRSRIEPVRQRSFSRDSTGRSSRAETLSRAGRTPFSGPDSQVESSRGLCTRSPSSATQQPGCGPDVEGVDDPSLCERDDAVDLLGGHVAEGSGQIGEEPLERSEPLVECQLRAPLETSPTLQRSITEAITRTSFCFCLWSPFVLCRWCSSGDEEHYRRPALTAGYSP